MHGVHEAGGSSPLVPTIVSSYKKNFVYTLRIKKFFIIIGIFILSSVTLSIAWFGLGVGIAFTPVCQGWNEGTMSALSCIGDSESLMKIYNAGRTLVLVSSFTVYIPLIVLGGISTLCAFVWFWIAFAVKRREKNAIPPFVMAALASAATLSFAWPIAYLVIAVMLDLKS
jgi:hypothetical protein